MHQRQIFPTKGSLFWWSHGMHVIQVAGHFFYFIFLRNKRFSLKKNKNIYYNKEDREFSQPEKEVDHSKLSSCTKLNLAKWWTASFNFFDMWVNLIVSKKDIKNRICFPNIKIDRIIFNSMRSLNHLQRIWHYDNSSVA